MGPGPSAAARSGTFRTQQTRVNISEITADNFELQPVPFQAGMCVLVDKSNNKIGPRTKTHCHLNENIEKTIASNLKHHLIQHRKGATTAAEATR